MPSDDISHPVPDLTGYITEGQIVLDRDLFHRGVYPPIAGLPSLSRLMKDGVGKGFTRDDHPALASQLFACYARVKRVRGLADVVGEEELGVLDKQYLKYGEAFERRFLTQGEYENRSIATTLDLGWEVLSMLPRDELHRVSDQLLTDHYQPPAGTDAAAGAAEPALPVESGGR
jgi:V/A-type H+-transporting ATPase subunit B